MGKGRPNWLVSLLFGPNAGKPNVERMKAERDIPGLVDALSYREYAISWSAQTALIDFGASAVQPLIDRIETADEPLRIAIVRLLRQMEDVRTIKPLIRLAKENSVNVRRVAVYALTRFDSPHAVEALCEALTDDDNNVQEMASNALQPHADGRIVAALIRAAQSPKASVEVQTLLRLALDRATTPVSTEDLRLAMQLNDSYVMIYAQAGTSCTFTSYDVSKEVRDFTQIKQMARQELIRRGVDVV